jgi:hypothetical protein
VLHETFSAFCNVIWFGHTTPGEFLIGVVVSGAV